MKYKVNIAVCGKFHYVNYINFLGKVGVINEFYFSHKKTTENAIDTSVSVKNYPLKEYLTQAHIRLFGHRFQWAFHIYERLWQFSVVRSYRPSKVLHYLANGTTKEVQIKSKMHKSILLAEAVNTHPFHRLAILENEARKFGDNHIAFSATTRHLQTIQDCWEADALLVPSEVVAESFRKYGYKKPIYKVPYAANIVKFEKKNASNSVPSDILRIICVGQIGYRKGQVYLLRAIRKFVGRVSLTLVGGVAKEGLSFLNDFEGEYIHLQHVPSSEMPQLLRNNDIMILPSLEEGLAVSLCEAMASGIAVITTKEAGGEEIIQHGVDGLIIESASTDAIEHAISELLKDRQLLASLGDNARKRVENRDNWESYANNLIEVYDEIVK